MIDHRRCHRFYYYYFYSSFLFIISKLFIKALSLII